MKRSLPFLILLMMVVAACKPTVPSDIIQPDDMEDILYEYHIAQAMARIEEGGSATSDYDRTKFFLAVLEKHHVTEAEQATAQKALDAEAWAVGQRGGIDVDETDVTYHNSAKYHAEQAAGSAAAAEGSAGAAAGSAGEASDSADAAALSATQAAAFVGAPLTASTAAGMTDRTKVYIYVGSETGYTAGDWYYWNGSAWADGGVYNSIADDIATTEDIDNALYS